MSSQLITYIHITPQLLDSRITHTHVCHIASHLITVLLMYRVGMDSNHGWWDRGLRPDQIIYIYCCALLPYMYYLNPLWRASRATHQSHWLMWLHNAITFSEIFMFASISARGWYLNIYIPSYINSIAATHHSMSMTSDKLHVPSFHYRERNIRYIIYSSLTHVATHDANERTVKLLWCIRPESTVRRYRCTIDNRSVTIQVVAVVSLPMTGRPTMRYRTPRLDMSAS